MAKTKRRVLLSVRALQDLFTEGKKIHACVVKGFPADAEIVTVDASARHDAIVLMAEGSFKLGADGDVFDITLQTISPSTARGRRGRKQTN